MNGRRWWLVIALILSIGANVGLFLGGRWTSTPAVDAVAAPDETARTDRPIPPRYRRVLLRMADELRLDPPTRTTFVEIHEDFFHETFLGRERVRSAQAALRAELLAATPDRERAEALVAELAAAQADLERAFVATFFDTVVLLDAEQALRYRRILGHLRRLQERRGDRADRGDRPRPPWWRDARPNTPPADSGPPEEPAATPE